jgi:hypothetical protein
MCVNTKNVPMTSPEKNFLKKVEIFRLCRHQGPVHSAYNPSFSACFFSRNSIFLSQQISQQCFSAGLSAQLNGSQLN